MTKQNVNAQLWMIMAWDGEGELPRRMEKYDEHRAYLNAASIEILVAGPTVANDGETPTGSFFVVRGTRDEAEAFNAGDPFRKNGIWDSITITEFLYRRGKLPLWFKTLQIISSNLPGRKP